MYIDESGIDNTEDYPYGYCQKGQRFYALKSGKKTQRISMVAALSRRKIVAPLTFEGHCNMDIFNGWFEQFLAPILEPGQTVILDNAIAFLIIVRIGHRKAESTARRKDSNRGMFFLALFFIANQ